MSGATVYEPDPTANNQPAVWGLVVEDMQARDVMGREKYGTPLQPFNGRDALWDAYQEVLDLSVYLRQAIFEKEVKDKVLSEVVAERIRQDSKWGEQNHDPFVYKSILDEEVGEYAKAVNEAYFNGASLAAMRAEIIQVAAVAVAIVECLDRGKWQWPEGVKPGVE